MTFSIIARDPNTGDLGVAVQSKFIAVGAFVPWAKAKIGAIATQAWANTSFGPRGLELLQAGLSAKHALKKLLANDDMPEVRQVAIIDSKGDVDCFTGSKCFEWAGHIIGNDYSCQGNILVNSETVESMASAFEKQSGDLIEKLLAAMRAADQEGRGDRRGKQSAALLVVREKGGYGGYTDRYVDIRIDEHPEPIKELERVFILWNMIFLEREDQSNLLSIEGEIAKNIKQVLIELGYLSQERAAPDDQWTEVENKALEEWIGINNFENKWRKDRKIWKSTYEYLIREKGTPRIEIRQMQE